MMEDLISRQAAIKAVENLPDCPNGFSDTYDKAYIIDVLEDLPSVQERKKGLWVRTKDEKINAWWYSCSECGAYPLKTMFGQYDALSVYCPNCGAKMEGAEDANLDKGHRLQSGKDLST